MNKTWSVLKDPQKEKQLKIKKEYVIGFLLGCSPLKKQTIFTQLRDSIFQTSYKKLRSFRAEGKEKRNPLHQNSYFYSGTKQQELSSTSSSDITVL